MKFLLGWLLVSIFGTLLALRLIRNGKSRHENKLALGPVEGPNQAAVDATTLQPDSHTAHQAIERWQSPCKPAARKH